MYTQIFKKLLFQIRFNDQDIRSFVRYCREIFANNDDYLKQCEQLGHNYRRHSPIWWYKNCTFLSSLLKAAIGQINNNLLIELGFFINDLCREIKELHTAQSLRRRRQLEKFTVYRRESVSEQEFYRLVSMENGLCSFNNFLLASRNKTIFDNMDEIIDNGQDLMHVLYEITIDPSVQPVYFAWISEENFCRETEDEILFSMHSVFRVGEIKQIADNHRFYQVELTLTTDTTHNLYALTKCIEEEIEAPTPWHRLARLLLRLEKYADAEQIYHRLISQSRDNQERIMLFEQLGMAKAGQRQYQQALGYYKESLKHSEESSATYQSDLARSYNNIASIYCKLKRYPEALSDCEKALNVWERIRPASEFNLADSYNAIALVYIKMSRYPEAFASLENALAIRQRILPSCHPDLAETCGNLGKFYEKTNEPSIAYSYYQQALEIGKLSLPPNHTKLQHWQNKLKALREHHI